MEIYTSWDDGSKFDIKIAELLQKYELPGIFFISTMLNELSNKTIRKFSNEFEIGGHSVNHFQDMKKLNRDEIQYEIIENKEWLEDLCQKKINWFCYPRGRYNTTIIQEVKNAGFRYARTTSVLNTTIPDELEQYVIKPTIHVYPGRSEYCNQNWLGLAKDMFLQAKKINGYYHLWGHGWEIEKFCLWEQFEELLSFIKTYRV